VGDSWFQPKANCTVLATFLHRISLPVYKTIQLQVILHSEPTCYDYCAPGSRRLSPLGDWRLELTWKVDRFERVKEGRSGCVCIL